MPGILGISAPAKRSDSETEAALASMAEPLRYNAGQTAQFVVLRDVAAGVVNHGKGFDFLKPATAQREGVLVLLDGEVYPDSCEVPPELSGGASTIQRAEYCLHLYLEHGLDAIGKLNGTFGLAIIDTRDGRIHLATDRFGHRWLFYWSAGEICAFASSVRSLLRYRQDIGQSYDPRALVELIVFERVMGDRTLFPDIKRLSAGHRATWTGREWEVQPYYRARLCLDSGGPKTWQNASAELVTRIRHSLTKRLADQAKTGLFLSGGLDSRLVLGCSPRPVHAFTYSHPDHLPSEARVALKLAQAAGVPCLPLERPPEYYASIAGRAVDLNDGLATFVGCHSVGLHARLADEGVRVFLTGDRSDVAFKDYFDGVLDRADLSPWTGDPLQRRRAARKLMSSPIIRRAHRQDLMMLALNRAMKLEFARTFELCLEDLQEWFTPGSIDETLAVMGVADWQGLTSMGFVRGLATEFVERSPFFDNDVWNLALSIPPAWRTRARIVRHAIGLASPGLARIPDVTSGIPPRVTWPWDGYYATMRQAVRNLGKKCAQCSSTVRKFRPPPPGTKVFTSSGSHDRDAALRHSAPYRKLVQESVEHLPDNCFDLATIRKLLSTDLSADVPQFGGLFEILITFAQFHRSWGAGGALRQRNGMPSSGDSPACSPEISDSR